MSLQVSRIGALFLHTFNVGRQVYPGILVVEILHAAQRHKYSDQCDHRHYSHCYNYLLDRAFHSFLHKI